METFDRILEAVVSTFVGAQSQEQSDYALAGPS
jgi:hypothetical protein